MVNKLHKFLSAKYLFLIPLIIVFACDKKVIENDKIEVVNSNNTLMSLVLTLSDDEPLIVSLNKNTKRGKLSIPYDTADFKSLKVKSLTFSTSASCSIKVGDTVALSSDKSFKIAVTAQNKNKVIYTINLLNTNNSLTSLVLMLSDKDSLAVSLDKKTKIGNVVVPYDADFSKLKVKNVSFSTSAICSVKVGDVVKLASDNTFDVVVTAQSDDKATYTINVINSNNALISLVLMLSDKDSLAVSMDVKAKTGKIGIPYDADFSKLKVKSLSISPLATCSVKVGDIIELASEKSFEVTVTAQNKDVAVYTIKVMNSNNALTSLVLSLSDKDIFVASLDTKAKTGKISIPHNVDFSKLKVKSLTFSTLATCSIKVEDVIGLSSNKTFKVIVTSQNDDKAVYTISMLNSNNALTSVVLTLSDKDAFNVSLDTKTKTGKVDVLYDTNIDLNKLKVKSVGYSTLATCSVRVGDVVKLDSNKVFNITVTAQNGDKATYIITVINSGNTLTSLVFTISDKDAFNVFLDAKTKKGMVSIPHNADLNKLKVKSVGYSTLASCSVKVGDVVKLDLNKTFKVTVIAQNGDKATYTISIVNSNNNLNSLVLTLSGNDFIVPIDAQAKTGKVIIPYDTMVELSKLKVKSIDYSTFATCSVKAGDVIGLDSNKVINIIVTAQNGDKATYTISIVNSNNNLNSLVLTLSGNDFIVPIDAQAKTGKVIIPYGTVAELSKLKVKSVDYSSSASCSVGVGNVVNLSSGNKFNITVTAQNGVRSVYTITIVNSSNTLNFLSLSLLGNNFNVPIDNNTKTARVIIPYGTVAELSKLKVKSIDYSTSATCSVAVGDFVNLDSTKTFKIIVTSQNGNNATYTITVVNSSNTLNSLSLSLLGNNFNVPIDNNTKTARVIIPYGTVAELSKLKVKSVDYSTSATCSVAVGDFVNLSSTKTFNITVTSQNGNNATYTITVVNSSNTLNSLSLSLLGNNFNVPIDNNTKTGRVIIPYGTVADLNSLTVGSVSFSSSASCSVGVGNVVNLSSGNKFNITVTSQNGNNATYTITIVNSSNILNSLSLSLLGKGFDVPIDNNTKTGRVIIPYGTVADLNSLTVGSVSFSSSASCSVGVGNVVNLSSGNKFNITVTSQNGDKATYTITVVNSSNILNSLSLSLLGNNFNVPIDNNTKTGRVIIPYGTVAELSKLKVKSINYSTSATCSVAVGDFVNLDSTKTFKITVTSQNGDNATYTITVVNSSNTLNSLSLSLLGNNFNVPIDNNTKTARVIIPYGTVAELSKLKVKSIDYSTSATCSVAVGDFVNLDSTKTFKIIVTSQNGNNATYTITVVNSSNTLNSLSLSLLGNNFNVPIDNNTKTGRVIIPYGTVAELSKLKVKSVDYSTSASCSVAVGDFVNLSSTKTFNIIVTSQNGNNATYTITIVNSSNILNSLSLSLLGNNFNVPIDNNTKTGRVIISYGTVAELSKLKVKSVDYSTSASCSVAVGDFVNLDSTKTFNIIVTSQNGNNATYTITVVNSSNTLNSLSLSLLGNNFNVPIDNNTKTGRVIIPYGTVADLNSLTVGSVSFSSSASCSVAVGDFVNLDSTKTFNIIVTSQNGNNATYTITVNKLLNTGKDFLTFKFLKSADSRLITDADFTINGTNITGTVTYLESNFLKPVFTVSPGATVKVKGVKQTSGVSGQDFTAPVTYTVIPEDTKEAPKTYIVDVNFYYDKLEVTANGTLGRKDPSKSLSGKLVLAERMNGYIVKSITNNAFKNCSGLTGSLILPNTITSIGESAFGNCKGFSGNLIISNSVKSMGERAFERCRFVGDLKLPDTLEVIESNIFYNCFNFTSLKLPKSLKTIKLNAFYNCSFTGNLIIHDSVTSIEKEAFYNCYGFDGSLTIPVSVTSIGESAFNNCYGFDGTLTIPVSVTSIGESAFGNCKGFTGICNKSKAPEGAFTFWKVTTNNVCP